MSSAVRASVDIHVSPQQVWDVVMDPRRLGSWVTTHQRLAHAPDRLSSGSSFEQTLKLAGKSFDVTWTVIEAEEPHLAEWGGKGPYGSRARVRYELDPLEGEGTRFGYENEFELPAGVLGKVAKRLLGASSARRESERSLENLKRMLEERDS